MFESEISRLSRSTGSPDNQNVRSGATCCALRRYSGATRDYSAPQHTSLVSWHPRHSSLTRLPEGTQIAPSQLSPLNKGTFVACHKAHTESLRHRPHRAVHTMIVMYSTCITWASTPSWDALLNWHCLLNSEALPACTWYARNQRFVQKYAPSHSNIGRNRTLTS